MFSLRVLRFAELEEFVLVGDAAGDNRASEKLSAEEVRAECCWLEKLILRNMPVAVIYANASASGSRIFVIDEYPSL